MLKRSPIIFLSVLAWAGCAPEPSPTATTESEAPPWPPDVILKPVPSATEEVEEPQAPKSKTELWNGLLPEERILRAYSAVICQMQRSDKEAVGETWKKYGYDAASWASAVQGAIASADADPRGFGKRWKKASLTRCQ